MDRWRKMPFSEAIIVNPKIQLSRSATYPFVDMAEINADLRWVQPSELRQFTGGGSRFAAGDTLLARITPCLENGKIARFYAEQGTVAHGSTEFIVIRGRAGVSDNGYAYYLTKWEGVTGYAISQMTGTSGRQRVPTQAFDHLLVSLPPLSEQEAIAAVLGSLDDKIDCNRRMNETLEAMARAIFKDWFVDLAQEIWDLFPDALDDEGKPVGWIIKQLGAATSYLSRGISPSYIERGGVLVLNQKCIRDRRVDWSKGRRHDPIRRATTGRLVQRGDILVNSTGVGTLGRVAQIMFLTENTIVDSHITIVRTSESIASWNYLGMNISGREAEIESLGEGSTGQTELSRARLAQLGILLPPRPLVAEFDRLTVPLREKMAANENESRTLAQTRDLLLPKLMSGEIRVKDAEKAVETIL